MSGSIALLWGVAVIMAVSSVAWLAMLFVTARRRRTAAVVSAVVLGSAVALLSTSVTSWQVALPLGLIAFSMWAYLWWQVTAARAYREKQRRGSSPSPEADAAPD